MELILWLFTAIVMAVVEAVTAATVTIWFIVGALVSFVVAWAGGSFIVQVFTFLGVSIVCLLAFRPIVVKYRKHGEANEATMVGRVCIVCEDIDNDRLSGRVRTSDDMTWAARSKDGAPIPRDTSVRVVAQESVKLIVEPLGAAQ